MHQFSPDMALSFIYGIISSSPTLHHYVAAIIDFSPTLASGVARPRNARSLGSYALLIHA
jgi:hypothetical protein